MRICVVSKYPPIEGQVSTVNYWLVRGLAAMGHEVTVVSNGAEADRACCTVAGEPEPLMPPGSVLPAVWMTGESRDSPRFVPLARPSLTELAGLAMRAVRDRKAEMIFSHYLEPYAVAGDVAASVMGVPHVVTHAGSDIGRLARARDLGIVYQAIASRATRFVAKNAAAAAFAGVAQNGKNGPRAYAPPPEFFNPRAAPLDVNAFVARHAETIERELNWHCEPFPADRPVIGVYGKLLETKGLLELVSALGAAASAGDHFSFLIAARWRKGEDRLRDALHRAGISARTWWLPMMPNWMVPALVRRCHVVAFLEREWPFPPHTSLIPKEILACGTCLLVSDEARTHPWFRDVLRDGVNCLVVSNPRNLAELTRQVQRALGDLEFAARLGANGASVAETFTDYSAFVRGWEALFEECVQGAPS